MEKLTRKEQTLLSYYIYNFIEESEDAMDGIGTGIECK